MYKRRYLPLLAGVLLLIVDSASGATSPEVPLRVGLTIVTAVHDPRSGDYESIKRIVSVTADAVTVQYSADVPAPASEEGVGALLGGLLGEPAKAEPAAADEVLQVRSRRTIRRQDLSDAREYMQYFGEGLPETMPGTTALGVSRAVLTDLKSRGAAAITMRNVDPFGRMATGISSFLKAMAGDLAPVVDTSELEAIDKISGTLDRVADAPGAFQVLMNGKPTTLPALWARGTLGDQPVELALLNDPDNPLALKWKIGDQNDLRVVQIHVPAAASADGPAGIERQLADAGRATVYGIYFDFGSATIKPESEPVLNEIVAVLQEHPDWKLAVKGHTDSIGGTAFNQALSKRRAAAVKAALVERFRVADGRLTTAGFGASRPRASNETLEGRAQNRRVELVRR